MIPTEDNRFDVDVSLGTTIVLGTLAKKVTTWNFINVPTETGRLLTAKLMLIGSPTSTYGDNFVVDGVVENGGQIKWLNRTSPVASDGIDILSFMLVRGDSGFVQVLGQGQTKFQ